MSVLKEAVSKHNHNVSAHNDRKSRRLLFRNEPTEIKPDFPNNTIKPISHFFVHKVKLGEIQAGPTLISNGTSRAKHDLKKALIRR